MNRNFTRICSEIENGIESAVEKLELLLEYEINSLDAVPGEIDPWLAAVTVVSIVDSLASLELTKGSIDMGHLDICKDLVPKIVSRISTKSNMDLSFEKRRITEDLLDSYVFCILKYKFNYNSVYDALVRLFGHQIFVEGWLEDDLSPVEGRSVIIPVSRLMLRSAFLYQWGDAETLFDSYIKWDQNEFTEDPSIQMATCVDELSKYVRSTDVNYIKRAKVWYLLVMSSWLLSHIRDTSSLKGFRVSILRSIVFREVGEAFDPYSISNPKTLFSELNNMMV
jgi:hypothetical protein